MGRVSFGSGRMSGSSECNASVRNAEDRIWTAGTMTHLCPVKETEAENQAVLLKIKYRVGFNFFRDTFFRDCFFKFLSCLENYGSI